MVPKGRRHATRDIWTIGEAAFRAISVACGTRGACDSTRAVRGSAGDRPPDGAVGVDDLAGAATQCRDAQRGPGLSGNHSAVACRPGGPAPETREAGGQRSAAHVCAGSVGRRGRHAKRDCDCRAFGVLERSSTRTSTGSAMGIGMESEQIAHRLRLDVPHDEMMRISHEAIYQSLYVQGRGALRRELTACLRTGRALRVPRARTRGRGKGFVSPEIMISERPAEAADRAVPGHWEGDLILGLESSAIGTLVERTTRFTMLLHLPRMDDYGKPRVKN